jgi:hypothetical protein
VSTSTLVPSAERATPSARECACRNSSVNLDTLETTQPALRATLERGRTDFTPVFGRDGSLTAFDAAGKWWRGCSVPTAAAGAMLASLDVKGRVACLLRPTLAAHVRVALRRSRADQAVIALCPDADDLRVLLHCDDFSEDLRARRLWFAWGGEWAAVLKDLFEQWPGLATPAQFIRLPITPADEVERMIPAAQAVFAGVNASRAQQVARRRDDWRPTGGLCVVAPSHFRLWDDAGAVLLDALSDCASVTRFDPDDPACSSALALLSAAERCDAVVTADTTRADVPGVLPPAMPWLTWVTRPTSIPPFEKVGPADGLVLADPAWRDRAAAAGWPAERVLVGGWPTARAESHAAPPRVLAIVADTIPVAAPERLAEYSSHRLLWDHLAAELETNPFAVGDSPAQFLERRMTRHGVRPDGFDAALFLERLILPAYAQSIARTLLTGGVPLRLFGAGWDRIDEFRPHAAGAVTSREGLNTIASHASALVHVWPGVESHPMHRLGLPVLRPDRAPDRARLLSAARQYLAGGKVDADAVSPVSLRTLLALLDA